MFNNINQQLATATQYISPVLLPHSMTIEDHESSLSIVAALTPSVRTTPAPITKTTVTDRKDAMMNLITQRPTQSVTTGTTRTTELIYPSMRPPRNIRFAKNTGVVMFKTKVLTGHVTARGKHSRTLMFKAEIGTKEIIGYSFMFYNDYHYVLLEAQHGKELSHSAKNYDGYKNVNKKDLCFATDHLFTDKTDMPHVYLPPSIQQYVNFYGNIVKPEEPEPKELLEQFRRVVLDWDFDLTPAQLENVFLRKVGLDHETFVVNNRNVFQHLAATTRYKNVQVTSVNEIADFVSKRDGINCFVKKETDLFTFFISKNANYYRKENIDHVFMDGTGSLPKPYSQLINISFYDPINKRHRFLGCFLLKDNKHWIDHYTWREIVKALDIEVPFKSASVDGERNLLLGLQGQGKETWGCHFHYSKSIAPFACTIKKKVRAEFYNVAKYFMFMDNPKEIFDKLYTLIKGQGERNLYNHISKTYMHFDYFQYLIPSSGMTREIAARFTTSPVEGINGALKKMLKQDKSPLSIYQFIRNMSFKVMGKVKETSVYQRLNLDEIWNALHALESVKNSDDGLITRYRCNQKRLLRYQSQKLRDDREYNAQQEYKKKQERAATRVKRIEKKKATKRKGALNIHSVHFAHLFKAFAVLKRYNNAAMEEEAIKEDAAKEARAVQNAEVMYNDFISQLFSLARETRDALLAEE